MVLRVSEVYASVQGEGPNVGETTVFVRFGGCNLRCPGWPCDTEHAINPAFRNEWERQAPEELYERIIEVAQLAGAKRVTLTGGEPFLQPQVYLSKLVQLLRQNPSDELHFDIDCFSNGTLEYPIWAPRQIQFIMDWKLPGSGEDPWNNNRINNLQSLRATTFKGHAIKFVCKDQADFDFALSLWSSAQADFAGVDVYYGRVWGGEITDAELCELVMKHKLPWKLNVQMHNYIWPANERGR